MNLSATHSGEGQLSPTHCLFFDSGPPSGLHLSQFQHLYVSVPKTKQKISWRPRATRASGACEEKAEKSQSVCFLFVIVIRIVSMHACTMAPLALSLRTSPSAGAIQQPRINYLDKELFRWNLSPCQWGAPAHRCSRLLPASCRCTRSMRRSICRATSLTTSFPRAPWRVVTPKSVSQQQ